METKTTFKLTEAEIAEHNRETLERVKDKNNPKNKQTIQDMYDFLASKDKKSQLYQRVLAMHKSGAIALNYGDLRMMAGMLRYKPNWYQKKAKELGITCI
jgi:hypothetical protein